MMPGEAEKFLFDLEEKQKLKQLTCCSLICFSEEEIVV
jgi:hypothetical protein